MHWRNVDKHHLQADGWTIAKCFVGDDTKYVLWRGGTLINVFDDADSAKEEAEKGMK